MPEPRPSLPSQAALTRLLWPPTRTDQKPKPRPSPWHSPPSQTAMSPWPAHLCRSDTGSVVTCMRTPCRHTRDRGTRMSCSPYVGMHTSRSSGVNGPVGSMSAALP